MEPITAQVTGLAEARSSAAHGSREEWEEALTDTLHRALEAGLTGKHWEQVAAAAPSIEALEDFFGLLFKPGTHSVENRFLSFTVAIDASLYSLTDWLEALHFLNRWIEDKGREASLNHQIGFLSCCAEFAERDPERPTMLAVVEDMLEEHGIDPE